jgi:hypothetical protein
MTNLSPAAQAVWDAAWQHSPINCESVEDRRRQQIAAALRAAVEQVIPEYETTLWGTKIWPSEPGLSIRAGLLAIAAELEGQ